MRTSLEEWISDWIMGGGACGRLLIFSRVWHTVKVGPNSAAHILAECGPRFQTFIVSFLLENSGWPAVHEAQKQQLKLPQTPILFWPNILAMSVKSKFGTKKSGDIGGNTLLSRILTGKWSVKSVQTCCLCYSWTVESFRFHELFISVEFGKTCRARVFIRISDELK